MERKISYNSFCQKGGVVNSLLQGNWGVGEKKKKNEYLHRSEREGKKGPWKRKREKEVWEKKKLRITKLGLRCALLCLGEEKAGEKLWKKETPGGKGRILSNFEGIRVRSKAKYPKAHQEETPYHGCWRAIESNNKEIGVRKGGGEGKAARLLFNGGRGAGHLPIWGQESAK